MREYTDCYVAFMDLLGFKNILYDKDNSCEDIASIFDEINKKYDVRESEIPIVDPNDMKYKVMSDSLVIYIDSSIENSLTALVFICVHFQVRLLRLNKPIIIRGGISRGGMYSSGDVVFGTGLSNAYNLENRIAKFPRIIIPMNIADAYIAEMSENNKIILNGFLIKDFDCFYTLNYFDSFTAWGYKSEEGERVKNMIYSTLSTSVDENIREKYLYLQANIVPKIEKRMEDNHA